MKQFTFIGCSFTTGVGLPEEKLDKNNYPNIIGEHFSSTVTNLSLPGNSNYNIFMSGINEMLFNEPDILFLQWSELQRCWFYPNLDIKVQVPTALNMDAISYLDTKYSKKFLRRFSEQVLLMNHDYHNILTLLNYCKILESIAGNKTKLVFINGLLPWTEEILNKNAILNSYKNLSNYTKNLLSTELLPNTDIARFFGKIYNGLEQINLNNWPNMFNSFGNLAIDLGTDSLHPGPKSHKIYATMIIDYLERTNA